MDRSSVDQAVELLTRAREGGVLLVVPADPSADAFAAMVALGLALDHLQMPAAMVSPSHVPPLLQFLPGTSQVHELLPESPELTLRVPLGGHRPGHIDWEVVDGTLVISVHPEGSAPFPETAVQLERGSYPWRCIVTVGAPRLHALGNLFTNHTELFYGTPIVNVDRGTANEFFGAVNLVPATAGTVTEVVADLLDALGGTNVLTPDVSTCLLAGLVAGTDSFRAPHTAPQTFQLASQLVTQEADRAAIVRRLFHTHALTELRLLGRALTRMEELRLDVLVSILAHGDFADTDTTPDAAPGILGELLEWVGERRHIVLAFERTPGTLEALVALGRVSADDRETFRAALGGVLAGPFVLANLGAVPMPDARKMIEETIVPRLPGQLR